MARLRPEQISRVGPFRVNQLKPGDPYELSDGHPVVCEPSGPRHGRRNLAGGSIVETDPAVESAGVDVGYALDERTLRAPDVSVGLLPDEAGFVEGAPPLAIEYVEAGCDERDLRRKIEQLLSAGTRFVWVVRLAGERQVEAYQPVQPGKPLQPRITRQGEMLEAPGVLRNSIPVEAFYERDAAHRVMLRNLLQRQGYDSLDAVRVDELRQALLGVLSARTLDLDDAQAARIEACRDLAILRTWFQRALSAAAAEAIFEQPGA